MSKKVLFVDDEQSLLNAIERRLKFDYDLITAISGPAALEAIQAQGPFAAIFTDMRMPDMDGIEFVKMARKLAPDSVYVMLTGNQDQETATAAVNEGQVFRFLNKPCESDALKKAIDDSIRQYELLTGEKELLHKTFCGAVGVLTEVLEISHPDIFSRAAVIQEIVDSIRTSLGFENRWEYKLACKLSRLGFALLPEAGHGSTVFGGASKNSNERFKIASQLGSKLITKIPRLETVAAMIAAQANVSGNFDGKPAKTSMEIATRGATLLRLAHEADIRAERGMTASEGIREIREMLPNLAVPVQQALEEAWPELKEAPVVELKLIQLREGMLLAKDAVTTDGAVLLRRGRRLTNILIEKLRCHRDMSNDIESVFVFDQPAECVVGEPLLV